MASTAANFRSRCGSERGAPEYRKQRCPAATPQVGHATEEKCLGVSSLFFPLLECGNAQSRICSLLIPAAQGPVAGTHANIQPCPTAVFILFARRNLVAAITALALITRKSHPER